MNELKDAMMNDERLCEPISLGDGMRCLTVHKNETRPYPTAQRSLVRFQELA
jgi:hypothetical protein